MSKVRAYFGLNDIDGKHNVNDIKSKLNTLPGVSSVSVNEKSGQVTVDFDTTGVQSDRIKKQLEEMGYKVVESHMDDRAI